MTIKQKQLYTKGVRVYHSAQFSGPREMMSVQTILNPMEIHIKRPIQFRKLRGASPQPGCGPGCVEIRIFGIHG